jgi:hypothetical protein
MYTEFHEDWLNVSKTETGRFTQTHTDTHTQTHTQTHTHTHTHRHPHRHTHRHTHTDTHTDTHTQTHRRKLSQKLTSFSFFRENYAKYHRSVKYYLINDEKCEINITYFHTVPGKVPNFLKCPKNYMPVVLYLFYLTTLSLANTRPIQCQQTGTAVYDYDIICFVIATSALHFIIINISEKIRDRQLAV